MSSFESATPKPLVPQQLEYLASHPEGGHWRRAIVVYRNSRRWPEWPLEFALAVVDSSFGIHQAELIVRPPLGWKERPEERDSGLSLDRVYKEGLTANQAMTVLNDLLGAMHVHTNASMSTGRDLSHLENEAGLRATWKFVRLLSPHEDLRLELGDHAYVNFVALMPTEGARLDRVRRWAEAFVLAEKAQLLLLKAMSETAAASDR